MEDLSARASDWNRGKNKYAPSSVLDEDRATAWCTRSGVGSWLSVNTYRPGRLTELVVLNGYQKVASDQYGDRFYTNSRVRRLKVELDGAYCNRVTLADHKQPQRISLAHCSQGRTAHSVRLTIESRYVGAQEPVCISEVVGWGNE